MTTPTHVASPTARDLLSSLAGPPPAEEPPRPIVALGGRAVRWCARCGAPRNLGRRDCPGCALLEGSRERIATYLARHGMPAGGAVELARRADVPLRAVGDLMAAAAAEASPPGRARRFHTRRTF